MLKLKQESEPPVHPFQILKDAKCANKIDVSETVIMTLSGRREGSSMLVKVWSDH